MKTISQLPYHLLRGALQTRGVRTAGHSLKSPAFFTPEKPHYGSLADDFLQRRGELRIVGFPKSGNVWITSLIATCLDLDVKAPGNGCRVIHTHAPLTSRDLFDKRLLRGAVLLRDLRDVIVSLYHFTGTEHFKSYHGDHHIFNDVESMYTDYFLPYFVERVQVLENLIDDYVYFGWPVLRYERFWDNAEAELQRLFRIWGIEVSDDKIASSVEKNSLSSMRSGEGKTRSVVKKSHFRKGGYGNYADEIPPHILADIEQRFGDYLRRWGYPV
jgi:hypothetical protein